LLKIIEKLREPKSLKQYIMQRGECRKEIHGSGHSEKLYFCLTPNDYSDLDSEGLVKVFDLEKKHRLNEFIEGNYSNSLHFEVAIYVLYNIYKNKWCMNNWGKYLPFLSELVKSGFKVTFFDEDKFYTIDEDLKITRQGNTNCG
jgi:hypothetical protein